MSDGYVTYYDKDLYGKPLSKDVLVRMMDDIQELQRLAGFVDLVSSSPTLPSAPVVPNDIEVEEKW